MYLKRFWDFGKYRPIAYSEIALTHSLSQLDAEILKTGGKLPWAKAKLKKK